MTTDAPTIAERYAVATTTKNLRVRGEAHKDSADIVIASGFAKGRGAVFARCRAEFDLAHAEYRGKVSAAEARRLACFRMPSRKAARAEALMMATSRVWGLKPAVLIELSWQALASWLDQNCRHCDGRGFTGGYDGPQVLCTHCVAGKTRQEVGKTDAERAMTTWLVDRIEAEVSMHAGTTARALK